MRLQNKTKTLRQKPENNNFKSIFPFQLKKKRLVIGKLRQARSKTKEETGNRDTHILWKMMFGGDD